MLIFCPFSAGPSKRPSSLPPVNICWPEAGSWSETRTWSWWWFKWRWWGGEGWWWWWWWWWRLWWWWWRGVGCWRLTPQRCVFDLHSNQFGWKSRPSSQWLECHSQLQSKVWVPFLCGKDQQLHRRSLRHQRPLCFHRCTWLHGSGRCRRTWKTWWPSQASALALLWKAAGQPSENQMFIEYCDRIRENKLTNG